MIAIVTKADQPELFNIVRTLFHAYTEAGDEIDIDTPPPAWEQVEEFDLVKWVAEVCGITAPLGQKGRRGVLKSQASRRAFLSDRSHRIRFVYLPKHSSWLNQIETVFGMYSATL
jgi:hypothetical protein